MAFILIKFIVSQSYILQARVQLSKRLNVISNSRECLKRRGLVVFNHFRLQHDWLWDAWYLCEEVGVTQGESGKLSAQRFNHLRGMTWFELFIGVNDRLLFEWTYSAIHFIDLSNVIIKVITKICFLLSQLSLQITEPVFRNIKYRLLQGL